MKGSQVHDGMEKTLENWAGSRLTPSETSAPVWLEAIDSVLKAKSGGRVTDNIRAW